VSRLFFADNTVLINFALLDRMDLLGRLANGCAAWTAAIRRECRASADALDNDQLRGAAAIFGTPVRMTDPRTIREALTLLEQMREPHDPADRHRGEAETIALIAVEHTGSLFVTDDADARSRAQERGIRSVSTCQLLRLAIRVDALTAHDAWAYVCELRRRGRTLHDSPHEESTYMQWCRAA
jgi:predicted nucleic acid-binding protein